MPNPANNDNQGKAYVPEHSVEFMRAVSGGTSFVEDDYLCFAAEDWLTIIGYPLRGSYSHTAYNAALRKALARTQATQCWTVAPDLPPELQPHVLERDVFYTLPCTADVPAKLRGPVRQAATVLRVDSGHVFTAEHRRLWAEFMGRVPLKARVRELFASTPQTLRQQVPGLELLNAWDAEGHLVACLLLDLAPTDFCSYILGAHSRSNYVPHAADLLFAHMIEKSRTAGKAYIHLGLGVNEGITRFKRKWGGQDHLPFVMAGWQESGHNSFKNDAKELMLAMFGHRSATSLHSGQLDLNAMGGLSKRQIWATLPEQRPYAMLWKLEKNGRTSWIGGSAHFFCYSFETSFRQLFDQVDTVIFEGPLDNESLAIVEKEGKAVTESQPPLFDNLTEAERAALRRMVRGPEGFWPRLLNIEAARKVDVDWYLRNARPWSALFTLWTGYLERRGWRQSVDLEAWTTAQDMGKTVIGMESLEEQLASLDSVPPERVVRYFRNCHQWGSMIKNNVQAYLDGDLMRLMGTSAEFPTRTTRIIGHRDERFRQRMRPFIEAGRCAVFVGTAHMLNLRHMLAEDGFTVTQVPPSWWRRLKSTFKSTPPATVQESTERTL